MRLVHHKCSKSQRMARAYINCIDTPSSKESTPHNLGRNLYLHFFVVEALNEFLTLSRNPKHVEETFAKFHYSGINISLLQKERIRNFSYQLGEFFRNLDSPDLQDFMCEVLYSPCALKFQDQPPPDVGFSEAFDVFFECVGRSRWSAPFSVSLVSYALEKGIFAVEDISPMTAFTAMLLDDDFGFRAPNAHFGRAYFKDRHNELWKERIEAKDARLPVFIKAYSELDHWVMMNAIRLRKYGRDFDFTFSGNGYHMLVSPFILKNIGNLPPGLLQFAILPRDPAMVQLMSEIHDPRFEHFDGAVANGHLNLVGPKLVIEEYQTDTGYLLKQKEKKRGFGINLTELVLEGIKHWMAFFHLNNVYMRTPYALARRYWTGGLHPDKLTLYSTKAESAGGKLVFDNRGELDSHPQHYYVFDR